LTWLENKVKFLLLAYIKRFENIWVKQQQKTMTPILEEVLVVGEKK
jgi:hypothetical protein